MLAAMTVLATDEYIFAPTTIGRKQIEKEVSQATEVLDNSILG